MIAMFPRKLRRSLLYAVWICPLLIFVWLSAYSSNLSQYMDDSADFANIATPKSQDQSNDKVNENSEAMIQQADSSNSATSAPTCQAKKSFVFIKTHKSGSTTMIASLQRFAYVNNLYMVVPSMDHNIQLGWPYRFVPLNNIVMPPVGKKFTALVNHVVYNRTVMDQIMDPQTVYITVVRDAKAHLLSAYNYFGLNEGYRIGQNPEAYEKFLNDTKRYDDVPEYMRRLMLDTTHIKTFTRNLQSADLGLEHKHFDNDELIGNFVKQIEKEFDFILVLERLTESLVLMKRKFCWTMQDIVRINKNRGPQDWGYKNINPISAQKAYKWNNADTLLYNMAQRKLNVLRKGQVKLNEEVAEYERIFHTVFDYCSPMEKWNTTTLVTPKPLIIGQSEFNEQFSVDRQFCVLLLLHEEDFTFLFKCKQNPNHRQCKEQINHLHELFSLIHGA